ncbi:MAG: sulfite exporter TauE/SafE family protein [Kiritimatiellae bacterium]|nr:sulfite exporter TauE/SafE family protein [Kiritimatiellia bacterium]
MRGYGRITQRRFVLCVASVLIASVLLAGLAPAAPDSAASPPDEAAAAQAEPGCAFPWWGWLVLLFVICFLIGLVAVPAGVGGGVLFVPIVGCCFPFHIDFVRSTGLLVALSSSLAAGPSLLRRGLANLRLSMTMALVASASSIAGALIGLALPTRVVQVGLGVTILGILVIMLKAGRTDFPKVDRPDPLGRLLGLAGVYHEESLGTDIPWQVHRTPLGLALFVVIGMLAGMFGMGAGWANVPALNLLLGVPLKVSVASSQFLLSITDTAAAWIYINKGAVFPALVVPCIAGVMIGSKIGARILRKTKPPLIRKVVLSVLFLAGLRALLKGLNVW